MTESRRPGHPRTWRKNWQTRGQQDENRTQHCTRGRHQARQTARESRTKRDWSLRNTRCSRTAAPHQYLVMGNWINRLSSTAPDEAETSGPHPAVATCASTACSSAARSATDSDATPHGDRQLDAVHACTRVRCRRGSRAPRHMVATDLSLATPSAAATAAQVPTSAPARAAVGTATASAPATAKVMTAASAGCRCACRKSHRQRHQLRRVGDVGHVRVNIGAPRGGGSWTAVGDAVAPTRVVTTTGTGPGIAATATASLPQSAAAAATSWSTARTMAEMASNPSIAVPAVPSA